MIELTPDECRVLGVLVEKELTTPEQYPLSLNAIVNGANQKNNRDPVLTITENQAFEAVESLRGHGLVIRVDVPGQRVSKFRHSARETLRLRPGEVAILAELLLRGPQTLGELRGRASRMSAMDSLDVAKDLLRTMTEREEPLVKLLPPSPGSRAERHVQLLCTDLHPLDATPAASDATSSSSPAPTSLANRVEALEQEVSLLKEMVRKLATALGEPEI